MFFSKTSAPHMENRYFAGGIHKVIFLEDRRQSLQLSFTLVKEKWSYCMG